LGREELPQPVTATTAGGQTRAILHDHHTFPFEQGLKFSYLVQINHRGAVDPEELVGCKFLLELTDARAQKIVLLVRVEA